MPAPLPSLNWLRTFEAAARHGNLNRAADELNVTPSAVSQQVKALEARVAIPLFRRVRQRLYLTDAGQAYQLALQQAFAIMSAGTDELLAGVGLTSLTVRAPSSFATQWLVPRLDRFHALYPNIDIRITALGREVDFNRDDIDLEIRYGDGNWPALEVLPFISEQVFPVCSPALLSSGAPLTQPADLAAHTLLDVPGYEVDWAAWLAAAGVSGHDHRRDVRFDQSVMAVQAAISGLGIALGRTPLVADEIAAGRLVAPFYLQVVSTGAYFIVYPPSHAGRTNISNFCAWLIDEAGI